MHLDYQSQSRRKVIQWTTLSGIAASLLVGGFIYLNNKTSATDTIPLQIDSSPVYLDSASYDSSQIINPKKEKKDVDKEQ